MDSDFGIYGCKSSVDSVSVYASVLGTLCNCNVLLWPMTLMLLFVGIMAAESEYTLLTRLFYFIAGS